MDIMYTLYIHGMTSSLFTYNVYCNSINELELTSYIKKYLTMRDKTNYLTPL